MTSSGGLDKVTEEVEKPQILDGVICERSLG